MRILGLIAVVAIICLSVSCGDRNEKSLKFYCGAGLRIAVDKLIKEFKDDTGIIVEPDYAGSGIIIARAAENKDGDLFMPGSVSYVNKLQEKHKLVEEHFMTSYFVPVIIVQKGNPKNIKSLKDLNNKDVVVALGNAKACQI